MLAILRAPKVDLRGRRSIPSGQRSEALASVERGAADELVDLSEGFRADDQGSARRHRRGVEVQLHVAELNRVDRAAAVIEIVDARRRIGHEDRPREQGRDFRREFEQLREVRRDEGPVGDIGADVEDAVVVVGGERREEVPIVGVAVGEVRVRGHARERRFDQFVDRVEVGRRKDRRTVRGRELVQVDLVDRHRDVAVPSARVAGIDFVERVASRRDGRAVDRELKVHRRVHDVRVDRAPEIVGGVGERNPVDLPDGRRRPGGDGRGGGLDAPVVADIDRHIRRVGAAETEALASRIEQADVAAGSVDPDLVVEVLEKDVRERVQSGVTGERQVRHHPGVLDRAIHLDQEALDQTDVSGLDVEHVLRGRVEAGRLDLLDHLDGASEDQGASLHVDLRELLRAHGSGGLRHVHSSLG
jgi:hypothetical protein